MTNPTSARRAAAADTHRSARPRAPRSPLARVLPAGIAIIACLLLAAVAAADGQAAALVLSLWVGVLVIAGIRLSEPSGSPRRARRIKLPLRATRRPVLVLAELSAVGEIGSEQSLPVVRSDAAIAVLKSRPRG